MPQLIDYQHVLQRMTATGFRSLYYNSGAFGFPPEEPARSFGWIGPADPTIRDAARPLTRKAPKPYDASLAALAERAWQTLLIGPAWIMPKSHWAYELDFGSKEWMPDLLAEIGVPVESLRGRNNAAAIEFAASEATPMRRLVLGLLVNLYGSDFALAFPGRPVVCTIHSHKQLWWTTTDESIADGLDLLLPPPQPVLPEATQRV
jgi:hypothetical protein